VKGLLLRLSALDPDAENAVRVISFFDHLITGRVDLRTLVRSVAELTGAPVGVRGAQGGESIRADAAGRLRVDDRIPAIARSATLADGTVVWVATDGDPLPLLDILVERFAIATELALDHARTPRAELGDPALVELALAESAGEAERSRALHLLGLATGSPLRVLALAGDPTHAALLVATVQADNPGVRGVSLGALHAVLLPDSGIDPTPPTAAGVIVGLSHRGPAITAPRLWHQARTAVRYATEQNPLVRAVELGALALLADKLGPADIGRVEDVTALDQLAAEPHGPDLLAVLIALCATQSVRQAATVVHRHHSTIPARLAHAEAVLGFPVDTAPGRFRLTLALTLRTLRDSTR
jgi:hypothetical protein